MIQSRQFNITEEMGCKTLGLTRFLKSQTAKSAERERIRLRS